MNNEETKLFKDYKNSLPKDLRKDFNKISQGLSKTEQNLVVKLLRGGYTKEKETEFITNFAQKDFTIGKWIAGSYDIPDSLQELREQLLQEPEYRANHNYTNQNFKKNINRYKYENDPSSETTTNGEPKGNGTATDSKDPSFLKDDDPSSKIDTVEVPEEKTLIDENNGSIGKKPKNNYNTEETKIFRNYKDSLPKNLRNDFDKISQGLSKTNQNSIVKMLRGSFTKEQEEQFISGLAQSDLSLKDYAEQQNAKMGVKENISLQERKDIALSNPEEHKKIQGFQKERNEKFKKNMGRYGDEIVQEAFDDFKAENNIKSASPRDMQMADVRAAITTEKDDAIRNFVPNSTKEGKEALAEYQKKISAAEKRASSSLGHGKAALAVGTAVTAGALVLGLSNSRGQQSNTQLYGQQPLSY